MSVSDFFSTHAIDVVGVFDTEFNQVFPGARPLKATVNDEATFFKHPLENSSNRVDHVIFMPVVITLSLLLSGDDYKSVYQEIKQLYRSQTELEVRTKTDTYQKMFIQSIPHDESPENFDSVIMGTTLQETQISTTEIIFDAAKDSDSDTANRGQQESKDPTDAQANRGSTLARWFK